VTFVLMSDCAYATAISHARHDAGCDAASASARAVFSSSSSSSAAASAQRRPRLPSSTRRVTDARARDFFASRPRISNGEEEAGRCGG
jgi:hypothetical protein